MEKPDSASQALGSIIRIDEAQVKDHLGEIVRSTVEDTLNSLLDAEADRLCGAKRYERSEARRDYRAGSYSRSLHTKAGEVQLQVPKLRKLTFETAIIERYRRRESSVEEALMEMYLAGVSVRRVEDITEALWGTKVSPGTVSDLNQKLYQRIEEWRCREIQGEFPYLYLDGICLKRTWGGEVRHVSVLVAVGVGQDGYPVSASLRGTNGRQILGVAEGAKEDKEGWTGFLRHLVKRGLKGVQLVISDKCLGLVESAGDFFPDAHWPFVPRSEAQTGQRCMVHFYRNVFTQVPKAKVKEVAAMLKAIHAQEGRPEALGKAELVAAKLEQMKLKKAAVCVRDGIAETLSYYAFPREHWHRVRTNNPLERVMREIRRRTRVVGCFPDGQSALMLVAARLRHIAGTKWGSRKYLTMELLHEAELEVPFAG